MYRTASYHLRLSVSHFAPFCCFLGCRATVGRGAWKCVALQYLCTIVSYRTSCELCSTPFVSFSRRTTCHGSILVQQYSISSVRTLDQHRSERVNHASCTQEIISSMCCGRNRERFSISKRTPNCVHLMNPGATSTIHLY